LVLCLPFLSYNTFWETKDLSLHKLQFSSHANGLLEQNGQNCGMAVSKLQISQSKWTYDDLNIFIGFISVFFFNIFWYSCHFVRNKQFSSFINIILTYKSLGADYFVKYFYSGRDLTIFRFTLHVFITQ
jgi:hypothetical protein